MAEERDDRGIRRIEKKYRRELARKRIGSSLRRFLLRGFLLAVMLVLGIVMFRHTRPKTKAPVRDALSVWVLDVGQGDAALLYCQGHAALIDAGEYGNGERILSAMRSLGIRRLDYIINSHPHADHIGGMQTVLRGVPADVLILPEIPQEIMPTAPSFVHALEAAEERNVPVRTAVCGETLPLGGAEITLFCTDNSRFTDLNDCSLICRAAFGGTSFLFTGDLEAEGEAAMLEAGLLTPVTVLKVPHHGSSSSCTTEFLKAVSPKLAVISVGAMNDYGHPSSAALARLRAAGSEIYRTDLDGTVLLTADGTQVTVRTAVKFE